MTATPAAPTPVTHDPDLLDPLADDPERVQQGGEDDDRGAVLVVVEDGDVELRAKTLLDLEAARGRDVLQVDAAEAGRDRLDGGDDLVRVLRVEADRPGVDAAELLEEQGLALHHRHRRLRPDVAEPEDGGAVGHDRDGVLLDRQVPGRVAVLLDREADAGDARGVGHREVVARLHRDLRLHLDLPAQVHEERAVRDALDLDAVDLADALDDPLEVVGVRGVHRDVADLHPALDPDEVDGPEGSSRLADRAREPPESTRGVGDAHADRGTERGRYVTHVRITPSAASAAISSVS